MDLKNFKKKRLVAKDVAQRTIDETQRCNECLNFIIDSKDYKKLKKIGISRKQAKEQVETIKQQFLAIQFNSAIIDSLFASDKRLFKRFLRLSEKVNKAMDEIRLDRFYEESTAVPIKKDKDEDKDEEKEVKDAEIN